jgi:hypothetical protein
MPLVPKLESLAFSGLAHKFLQTAWEKTKHLFNDGFVMPVNRSAESPSGLMAP